MHNRTIKSWNKNSVDLLSRDYSCSDIHYVEYELPIHIYVMIDLPQFRGNNCWLDLRTDVEQHVSIIFLSTNEARIFKKYIYLFIFNFKDTSQVSFLSKERGSFQLTLQFSRLDDS